MKKGIDYTAVSSAFYCHDGNGRFFFTQRSEKTRDEHGKWECGGGSIKFGESPEETLLRELKEEYGCEGVIEEKMYPLSSVRTNLDGETTHWITFAFVVKVNPTEVIIGEPENVSDFGWFTLDNLPSPIHPGVAKELEIYADVLQKYSS